MPPLPATSAESTGDASLNLRLETHPGRLGLGSIRLLNGPVVVLSGVPADPAESDRVVEDEMGEESPVLVAPRRVMRKVESVPLEILPEQLGRQRMVRGTVLRTAVGAFQRPSNRIARFPVTQLHDGSKET